MPSKIKIKLPPRPPFKRIGLAGLGLIGGSLAKALKPLAGLQLYAFDGDPQTVEAARRGRQFAGVTADPEVFAAWPLDLAYLCLPVARNVELLNFLAAREVPYPVTDAGSTKAPITEAALKSGLVFCGGHPISGREVSGYQNSSADLIKGCLFVLTPDERFGPAGLDLCGRLFDLHTILNCRIKILPPREHDRIYALVSHLVQLTASGLAGTVKRLGGEAALFWAGSGFRDTTRLAASDPGKWVEIFMDNADNLVTDLEALITVLNGFKKALAGRDQAALLALLAEFSAFRRNLPPDH